MKAAWIVYGKEMLDALRDRKTLATLIISTLLTGPLIVMLLSMIVSQQEERAERREVWVAGIERAPALENFLQRQGLTIRAAPADYVKQLHEFSFNNAVIEVPDDFTEEQGRGGTPELRVVFDSANRDSLFDVRRGQQLLQGFVREQATLELALRGVAVGVLEPYRVVERNLADQQSQSTQLTAMLPWMIMMAVLYGGFAVAVDITAGERERTSLEPLLINPVASLDLVLGKWLAASTLSMATAVLSVLSIFPAIHMIRSETLQALFRFGPQEGAMFVLMLLPLAAAVSAVLMLVAIHGHTYKEAQARATFAMMAFQMLPLLTLTDTSGEKPWHLWVPSLAQLNVMLRALRGDPLYWQHLLIPTLVSLLVAALCLGLLAARIRTLAVR